MKELLKKLSLKKRPYLILVIALSVTLVLWLIPFGKWIVYPFSLFVTWAHELFQGFAAELCNFHFEKLILYPDSRASGEAVFVVLQESGRLRQAFVASAGYVGSAVLGGAMLVLKTRNLETRVLQVIVGVMAASALIYARSLFSFFSLLILSIGLIILIVKAVDPWRSFFYDFLACQVCLNALLDVQSLYSGAQGSDAGIVSRALFFPYWFWATVWLLLSLGIFGGAMYWAIRHNKKRSGRRAVGIPSTDRNPEKTAQD